MRTLTRTVFTYDELSDSAKSAARDWWRGCEAIDFDTSEIFDDAAQIAAMLGITFRQLPVKLRNGATRYDPAIYWSGFSCQGDGACFEGSYCYAKGAAAAIAAYAPQDSKLASIATRLTAIQRRAFYRLSCAISHHGNYSHAYSMRFEFEGATETQESEIGECLRDFANWIYDQLQREYDYRMSDENVAESIQINDYEFDENGARVVA